jgi:hypothetical protein
MITNRTELAEYMKRQLGAPVITINVAPEQIEDCINDAIQYYTEYHMDGITRDFYSYQVTSTDAENGYIDIPDSILFVVGVPTKGGYSNSRDPLLSTEYAMHLNSYFSRGGGYFGLDATSINMFRETIGLTRFMMNREPITSYSRIKSRLYFHDIKLREGEFVVVECFRTADPEEYPKIYNEMILKRHATALLKKQWGTNLSKFEGVQLIGGVTFSGRQLFDDAVQEITKIEEEYDLKYQEPADFFIG